VSSQVRTKLHNTSFNDQLSLPNCRVHDDFTWSSWCISHLTTKLSETSIIYHRTQYNLSNRKNNGKAITLLTNSTEQSPSWKGNSPSAPQEIPRILWNANVHYRAHNNRLLVPIVTQSIQSTHPQHLFMTNFNIILPPTTMSSKWCLSLQSSH
jgi:hypothetical protein